MKRKFGKIFFNIATIFCLLSMSVTNVYASTSEISDYDETTPVIISLVMILFVLLLVVGIFMFKLTKKGGYGVSDKDRKIADIKLALPDRTKQITEIIKKNDPKFSEVKFKSFAEYVYTTLIEESFNRDISHIRLFLHDSLYKVRQKNIDMKIQRHIISVLKNIDVSDTYFTSYSIDENTEILSVCIYTINNYWEIDPANNQVISGSKNSSLDVGYILNFMRKSGVKTNELNQELKSHNCPNCGAPLGNTGKCNYCNSILTTGIYSWVLLDYNPIIQKQSIDYGININRRRIV